MESLDSHTWFVSHISVIFLIILDIHDQNYVIPIRLSFINTTDDIGSQLRNDHHVCVRDELSAFITCSFPLLHTQIHHIHIHNRFLSHITFYFFRPYNPFFEQGYDDVTNTDSGSNSDDDRDLVPAPVLEIPLSLIMEECGDDTGRLATFTHLITDPADLCTPQPAAKVLSRVEALDLDQIIASPCCSALCLRNFDRSQIRACRIRYLSMTQAASRQWLRTLMENQPRHSRLYHLYHEVCPK